MKYESFFADALARVKDEQRYRVFVELERLAGPISARDLACAGRCT